jgi:hypothetical protein
MTFRPQSRFCHSLEDWAGCRAFLSNFLSLAAVFTQNPLAAVNHITFSPAAENLLKTAGAFQDKHGLAPGNGG